MIKALIFDLDDTLYYEKEYVLGAFKEVAYYLGSKYKKNEEKLYTRMKEILETSGRGKIFDAICKENNFSENVKDLVDVYRNSKPKLELYEDSKQTLSWAREQGYKLGIITDGCSKVQWNKIKSLKLENLVDKVIVTDDLGKEFWKPHQKSYVDIMEYFNVNKCEAVYIGDNPSKDFIGAKKLGLKTIRIIRENGDHINVLLSEEYEAGTNIVSLSQLRALLENKRLE